MSRHLTKRISEHLSTRKQMKEEEKYGEKSMFRFRECAEGRCGLKETHDMSCGCGVGLHVKCAGVHRGAAALGVFECGACRYAAVSSRTQLTLEQKSKAEEYAWEDSKGALTSYAYGTYKGQAALVKHISEWHEATGITEDPLRSVNALALFLRWDTANRDGGRSRGPERGEVVCD